MLIQAQKKIKITTLSRQRKQENLPEVRAKKYEGLVLNNETLLALFLLCCCYSSDPLRLWSVGSRKKQGLLKPFSPFLKATHQKQRKI